MRVTELENLRNHLYVILDAERSRTRMYMLQCAVDVQEGVEGSVELYEQSKWYARWAESMVDNLVGKVNDMIGRARYDLERSVDKYQCAKQMEYLLRRKGGYPEPVLMETMKLLGGWSEELVMLASAEIEGLIKELHPGEHVYWRVR